MPKRKNDGVESQAKKAKKAPAKKAAPKTTNTAKAKPKAKPKPAGKVVRRVDPYAGGGTVFEDFDCTLNQTNLDTNNNKFYIIQLLKQGSSYQTFTRWGRVGEGGQTAFLAGPDLASAKKAFEKKFRDKTGNAWSARAKFVEKDRKYKLIKLKLQQVGASKKSPAAKPKAKVKKSAGSVKLSKEVQTLIRYIFDEAKQSLTTSINATITENGIETPLGVLDTEQVKKGEDILAEAMKVFNSKQATKAKKLEKLSSQFYTAIPHRYSRSHVPPVLNSAKMFTEKLELLELLRDMVNMSQKDTSSLYGDDVETMYTSLGASISHVGKTTKEFKEVADTIKKSQQESHGTVFVKIKNVFKVRREEEQKRFTKKVGNHKHLFHGSRIANWVGLLSRGILMPKVVVGLGVHRTDAGWLGSGIYFGNADTAAGYAGLSTKRHTAFMLMNTVALGKMKDYEKITYGLTKPPKGYDSAHGVAGSEFYDDEYVVYDDDRQKIDYLIEFTR
eukprot:m.12638 g.12638  ORF g.12638 m.12638 type:complete len:501 (+) comp8146_c0_seq1:54-1556(+)